MTWLNNSRAREDLYRAVLDMWGGMCWLCRKPIDLALPRTHKRGLTLDHVVPRVRTRHLPAEERRIYDAPRYLRPAHRSCNSSRQAGPPPTSRRQAYTAPGFFPASGPDTSAGVLFSHQTEEKTP